jgi:hypothetical protein
MKVFKYALAIDDEVAVRLPVGARILSVQMQHGVPMLWALVDDSAATEIRRFAWRGTGHDAAGLDADAFIATVQLQDGTLIFHLFELRP